MGGGKTGSGKWDVLTYIRFYRGVPEDQLLIAKCSNLVK